LPEYFQDVGVGILVQFVWLVGLVDVHDFLGTHLHAVVVELSQFLHLAVVGVL